MPFRDTREIFDHGGVTSYTGDVRSLFEIQNSVATYYRMLDIFEKREPASEALICEFQQLLTQEAYDTLRYQEGERPGAYKGVFSSLVGTERSMKCVKANWASLSSPKTK